jgi:ubiquinone biosynthesis protein
MIKPKYGTTPLQDPARKEPLEIRPAEKPSSYRFVYIYYLFGMFLLRTGLLKISGRLTGRAKAQALRDVLEKLGGLWVKLGQFVAMRTDAYGKEFCDELSKLQDRAYGFSPALSRRTIEEELACNLDDVFSEFDPEPIAAASLAQVHVAKLRAIDCKVAIKVQKPYAQEYLRMDMALLKRWFHLLGTFGLYAHLSLEELAWEMNQVFTEEIDFRLEAVNLQRFRKVMRQHGILVPRVFKRLCTRRMVVMEYVQGVTMAEYIKVKRSQPERLGRWLEENQVRPKKVGDKLVLSVLRQLFEENLFHGDLHPGNIMLLARNRVALIDLGSVGSTDSGTLNLYRQHVDAAQKRQYEKAAELLLLTAPSVRNMDVKPVVREIARSLRASETRAALTNISHEERAKVFSDTQDELNRALAKFKLAPDWSWLKFARAMGTLEHTLVHLDPKMNFNRTFARYFSLAKVRNQRRLQREASDLPQVIADNGTLFLNELRRRALPFTATLDKVSGIIGAAFRGIRFGLGAGFALCVWLFLYQHYHFAIAWMHTPGSPWTARLDAVPRIGEWPFFLGLLAMAYWYRKFWRWVDDLNEPPARR